MNSKTPHDMDREYARVDRLFQMGIAEVETEGADLTEFASQTLAHACALYAHVTGGLAPLDSALVQVREGVGRHFGRETTGRA